MLQNALDWRTILAMGTKLLPALRVKNMSPAALRFKKAHVTHPELKDTCSRSA